MQDEHRAALAAHAQNLLALIGEAQQAQEQEAALHQSMREIQARAEAERHAISSSYQAIHPQVAGTGTDNEKELDALGGALANTANMLHVSLGAPFGFVDLKHAPLAVMQRQARAALDALQPAEQAVQSE